MRTLLIALLATAALPAAALAQDMQTLERPDAAPAAAAPTRVAQTGSRGSWRGQRSEGSAQRAPRTDSAARPARNWGGSDGGQIRPQRTWNTAGDAQARPQRNWGDGNRGRRFDNAQTAPAQVQSAPPVQAAPQQTQGRRNWSGNAAVQADSNRADRRGSGWTGNTSGRRDWDRNNDGRRDWNRGDDNRRDWNRNDGRRDWGNSRRDTRNWDRGWRNNSRYDWQRHRSANRYAFRLQRYAAPYGWNYGYRRYSIGATLFAGLFAQDYWISDPWSYRLPPVYWPYQWVRYYNDALLVDTRSGQVVDSIPDIFWY